MYNRIALFSRIFHKIHIHLFLIALLGLLVYSNTFNVPFHFDDDMNIANNPFVKDISFHYPPSSAKEYPLYNLFKSRYVGILTFALNYKIHGLDVSGYHVVNLLIHILNAFLVYFLVTLTFRTPVFHPPASSSAKGGDRLGHFDEAKGKLFQRNGVVALFAALLFVSHPVQTQAVTYIVQRFASLATFFYLLSLVLYVKWRLSPKKPLQIPPYPLYLLSLLCAVAAMKTKEISFTLPMTIALYEFMFFNDALKKKVLPLIPLFLTLLIIPMTFVDSGKSAGDMMGDVIGVSKVLTDMPRLDYLYTEFRVVVTYIRLLVFPISQNLDYDYPVYRSFFNPQVLGSFLLIASILMFGIYLLYRSRKEQPSLRLASFGIFYFFLTLAPESGVIPIVDLIFEHRLYLPSAGACMVAAAGISVLADKSAQAARVATIVCATIIFSLSLAAFSRNEVWRDRLTLWEDVVEKSPAKDRPHNNLGNAYLDKGDMEKAIHEFGITLKLNPDNADAHYSLGVAYSKSGLMDEAIEHFRRSIALAPGFVDVYNDLGVAYAQKGHLYDAMTHFKKALEIDPSNAMATQNMNRVLNLLNGK